MYSWDGVCSLRGSNELEIQLIIILVFKVQIGICKYDLRIKTKGTEQHCWSSDRLSKSNYLKFSKRIAKLILPCQEEAKLQSQL